MFSHRGSHYDQRRDATFFKGRFMPWFICLLAAVFYAYDFLLRVFPSVMIQPLRAHFGVNAMQIGLLSAFYYYAYTPLQLPSGAVVDKYSRRWVLTFSVLLCVLATWMFTITTSLTMAYVSRLMMGVGSAFAFTGALKLAAMWLPKRQFAMFAGIATALGTIGAITADTALSYGIHHGGWRPTLQLTALVGLVLAVLIFAFVRDQPQWMPKVSDSYGSWRRIFLRMFTLLKGWRYWVNGIVGAVLFLPVSMFASLWGVDFIHNSFRISPVLAASMTSLIFWGTVVGMPLVGWFSDRIKRRRILLIVGSFFTLLVTCVLIYVNGINQWEAASLLFAMGLCASPQVLVFSIAKEVSPPMSTGISTASTNFIVTISAAIFQPLIGYLLDLHAHSTTVHEHYSVADFRFAFSVMVAVLLLTFFFSFLVPETRCRNIFGKQRQQLRHA
jgi:MFS family permease